MPVTFSDTFPAPALDVMKWTSFLGGSVGIDVGVPTDGVYPLTVDDPGDSVMVDSDGKIPISANQPFDMEIGYKDVYTLTPVSRYISFGWRSVLKGGGVSLWGVELLLRVAPGPTYSFLKGVISNGVATETLLGPDPTGGADGRFRVKRVGNNYELYYYNGGWVLLDTVVLGYTGLGYVRFGVVGFGALPIVGFPWIMAP